MFGKRMSSVIAGLLAALAALMLFNLIADPSPSPADYLFTAVFETIAVPIIAYFLIRSVFLGERKVLIEVYTWDAENRYTQQERARAAEYWKVDISEVTDAQCRMAALANAAANGNIFYHVEIDQQGQATVVERHDPQDHFTASYVASIFTDKPQDAAPDTNEPAAPLNMPWPPLDLDSSPTIPRLVALPGQQGKSWDEIQLGWEQPAPEKRPFIQTPYDHGYYIVPDGFKEIDYSEFLNLDLFGPDNNEDAE